MAGKVTCAWTGTCSLGRRSCCLCTSTLVRSRVLGGSPARKRPLWPAVLHVDPGKVTCAWTGTCSLGRRSCCLCTSTLVRSRVLGGSPARKRPLWPAVLHVDPGKVTCAWGQSSKEEASLAGRFARGPWKGHVFVLFVFQGERERGVGGEPTTSLSLSLPCAAGPACLPALEHGGDLSSRQDKSSSRKG